MLQTINEDKQTVTRLCNSACVAMWLDAADVCKLTFACPYKRDTQLSCRRPHDIGLAWKQCSGPDNRKRMAFIFDYYGTEVYRRALGKTHQAATSEHIMATMGVVMDVGQTEMRSGHKTCVQQQYSCSAKNGKNNILRVGWNQHHVRVNLEQGKGRTNKNWKRPKEVFFNSRRDKNVVGEMTVVEKVSTPGCGCMGACVVPIFVC